MQVTKLIMRSMLVMLFSISLVHAEDYGGPVDFDKYKQGQKTFLNYCAQCHGEKADGNGRKTTLYRSIGAQKPSNFTLKRYHCTLEKYLADVIRDGGKKHSLSEHMPPFGQELNDKVVNNLVYFIRFVSSYGIMSDKQQQVSESMKKYLRPPMPFPDSNQYSSARVKLGKKLFFDKRLSGPNKISCSTCHNPEKGWSDGLPTAKGLNNKTLSRATPTIINSGYNRVHMWDGRFRTLEDQALGPMSSPEEMGQDLEKLVDELLEDESYRLMFKQAYPGEKVDKNTVAKALAIFERTIISDNTPFDQWVKGDENAISQSAKNGFKLFEGKAACSKCHSDYNFTDDSFHNIGLKDNKDQGRYVIRKVKILKGAFKTPTLREIAKTAPYMHNGSYNTLMEVIDHYDRGGDVKENLSPDIEPLNLTREEKQDLVEFMKSLSTIEALVHREGSR